MRLTFHLRCLGPPLCLLLSGCMVCQSALRVSCVETDEFSSKGDRVRSIKTYQVWAEQAWNEQASTCPNVSRHADYRLGFLAGFVDYVYAGGTGEPPPVPPRRFWNVDLRSPRGQEGADQWFAGFRHGAAIARDGGYRDIATVRSSVLGGISSRPDDVGPDAYGDESMVPWTVDESPSPANMPLPSTEESLPLPDQHRESSGEETDQIDIPPTPPESHSAALPKSRGRSSPSVTSARWQSSQPPVTEDRWSRRSGNIQLDR